jgi:MscS family membrane protein
MHLHRLISPSLALGMPSLALAQEGNDTAAAAALVLGQTSAHGPDFIEHVVDIVLHAFDIPSSGNTVAHYGIASLFLVGAYLLRHVVTRVIFAFFRKMAEKTETTLDDKLFAALERSVAAGVVVFGAVSALKVLKLAPALDEKLSVVSTVAFSFLLFWFLYAAFDTVLDHLAEVARDRQMGVAVFMPWIKKTLITVFVIFGGLMVAQSLGYDVKAFLAGLGIGGLAFALAAQDTIANLFGSVVVAIDQPFRVGEYVRIGSQEGTVEDIGLRSTKLRTPQRTLIAIPNKSVAGEAINNFSRMPQRRVDQTIGITYDAKPDQIEGLVGDIRALLAARTDLSPDFIEANFTTYGAYSLDIQIIYFTSDPDFRKHLKTREEINYAIMRAVQARGLSFAFPTQTIQLEGDVARSLARKSG